MPRPSKVQARRNNARNVERSDNDTDIENMWRPSPTPSEDFSDADGANSDGEWPLEIISEQATHYGDVKYEVRWGNWSRPDGSNTTWDNRLVPDSIKEKWDHKQRLRRRARAKRSRAVRIPGTLAVTDMVSFVRSQAVKEIVEEQGTPNLREKMETVMRDTDPAIEGNNASSSVPPTTFRNLLQTVKRSLKQSSSTGKPVSRDMPISSPLSPRKRRRVETSPESDAHSDPRQSSPELADPVKLKNECEDPKNVKVYPTQTVRLEGRCEDTINDQTPSPPMATKRRRIIRQYSNQLAMKWSDIAKATGAAHITFTNEVDNEAVPKLVPGFSYIEIGYSYSKDVPTAEELEESLLLRCNCRSCRDPSRCECQSISDLVDVKGKKKIAYDTQGLFAIRVTPGLLVIECNKCCHCDLSCPNRVSQRPRKVPIDIFKTADRGWGARPLCNVRKGTVLGIYTGTLMNRIQAEELAGEERGFCFDLDGQENPYEDEPHRLQAYTINSSASGNWTRFINHSCSPNLQVYQVIHDTIPEMKTPFLVFCALKDIPAKCEFTFDYDPCASDVEEKTSPKRKGKGKKGKRNFIPEGAIPCKCGEKGCRQWVRVLD